MKNKYSLCLTIICFCMLLISCSSEDDFLEQQSERLDTSNVSYSNLETEILNLINNHRNQLGLNSLGIHNIVSATAQGHTDYMIAAGEVSHDNFGRRHEELVNQANALAVSENVAFGFNSARSVVNAWLNSESHRLNIENADHTDMGIAIEQNESNQYYFTHIFIKK